MAVRILMASAVVLGAYAHFCLHVGLSPVLTGSMVPTFSPGDAVVTRPVPVSQLRAGQIALAAPPGEATPFAHRVVAVRHSGSTVVLTTKGDANPGNDRWHSTIAGPDVRVAMGSLPWLGRGLLWVSGRQARAGLTGAFGLVLTAAAVGLVLGTSRSVRPGPAVTA